MTTETEGPGTREMKDWEWCCEKCGCRAYARIDAWNQNGRNFLPGPEVRCVGCKDVTTRPLSELVSSLSISAPQATNCAVCGVHKPTPLRRDEMGGYVCLTCVEARLDALSIPVAAQDVARAEVEPDFYALHSPTRMHIGLWPKREDAYQVAKEYENCTITPLFLASPPSVPTTIDEAEKGKK